MTAMHMLLLYKVEVMSLLMLQPRVRQGSGQHSHRTLGPDERRLELENISTAVFPLLMAVLSINQQISTAE
jgi:hypothetical protein